MYLVFKYKKKYLVPSSAQIVANINLSEPYIVVLFSGKGFGTANHFQKCCVVAIFIVKLKGKITFYRLWLHN